MYLMIIVIIVSLVLSMTLNKLAVNNGWKEKAMEYLDENPRKRSLPMYIGGVGILVVILLNMLKMPIIVIVPVQIIIVTFAVFLFELFREE